MFLVHSQQQPLHRSSYLSSISVFSQRDPSRILADHARTSLHTTQYSLRGLAENKGAGLIFNLQFLISDFQEHYQQFIFYLQFIFNLSSRWPTTARKTPAR